MNETNNTTVTVEELNNFVAAVSARHNDGLKAAYPTCKLNWERIELAHVGPKYARLVTARPTVNRETDAIEGYQISSAFAFIDLSTGNILKPNGCRTPAKHARGNIRNGSAADCWSGAFTSHGGGLFVAYLR